MDALPELRRRSLHGIDADAQQLFPDVGFLSAACTTLCNLPIAAFGVAAGAIRPYQPLTS